VAPAKNAKPELTVDEIIGLLKKSALPTVVVEGDDDMIIYRRLEARLAYLGVSVFPVGGKTKVLSLFCRRTELRSSLKLAFLVDQDTWVNTGVPAEYDSPVVLLTWGYSIENDVYVDGELDQLLSGADATRFEYEIDQFVEWYALALSRHLRGAPTSISLDPNHVLDVTQRSILLSLEPNESYPTALRSQIRQNFAKLLRGKSLLSLLIRNTNSRPGQPKHSDKALLEMVSIRPGPIISGLTRSLEAIFK
jgi:hypothetical protein